MRDRTVFWGEQGHAQPVGFRSSSIPAQLLPGTVIAAECCYGAELYAPGRGQLSISGTYLQRKAAAYVGSTTIAYGDYEGQGDADLLTQYFIQFVLRGHSVGRAFLQARQKFLTVSRPRITAIGLKTVSQFLLLGDPSIHLVKRRHKSLVIEKGELLVESKTQREILPQRTASSAGRLWAHHRQRGRETAPGRTESPTSATPEVLEAGTGEWVSRLYGVRPSLWRP